MARLSAVADSSALLHFRQNHWAGWIFVLAGAALCALPAFNARIDEPWTLRLFGGGFAAIGLLVAFYRIDVRLDLVQRRYRIIHGFWPNPRTYSGGFDAIEGLWFANEWRTSGGKGKTKYLVWQTALKVRESAEAIALHESRDEADARRWFEQRARQLRVTTQDFTTETPTVRNWDRLDDPATLRVADSGRNPAPVDLLRPPDGLTVRHDREGVVYVSAAPGWNSGSVIVVLVGLLFCVFGMFAFVFGLGVHEALGWRITVSGSPIIAIALGIIFVLVGGGIIKVSIDHASSERRFALGDDEFVYAVHVRGRVRSEDRMKYSEIEQCGLRDSTAHRRRQSITIGSVGAQRWSKPRERELFIRMDRKVVTIRDLNAECATFLVNAFHMHGARRAVFRKSG